MSAYPEDILEPCAEVQVTGGVRLRLPVRSTALCFGALRFSRGSASRSGTADNYRVKSIAAMLFYMTQIRILSLLLTLVGHGDHLIKSSAIRVAMNGSLKLLLM